MYREVEEDSRPEKHYEPIQHDEDLCNFHTTVGYKFYPNEFWKAIFQSGKAILGFLLFIPTNFLPVIFLSSLFHLLSLAEDFPVCSFPFSILTEFKSDASNVRYCYLCHAAQPQAQKLSLTIQTTCVLSTGCHKAKPRLNRLDSRRPAK